MIFIDNQLSKIWMQRADQVPHMDLVSLKSLRRRARSQMSALSDFSKAADARFAGELSKARAPSAPDGSDWKLRPELWTQKSPRPGWAPVKNNDWLGHEIQVFHDCPREQIIVRQHPGISQDEMAPYEVDLEIFDFSGSFLSMVYNFPAEAVKQLSRRHIIRVEIEGTTDTSLSAYVQLNVKHGPNVEQMVVDFDLAKPEPMDFDLAYTSINDKRVEAVWTAIILNRPGMSAISFKDFVCSRRLRAEF